MPIMLPLLALPAASAGGPGATITAGSRPNLRAYDLLRAGVSGGKDTWAALAELRDAADAAGVLDRLWTDHADLGLAEWPGVWHNGRYWPSTGEFAALQSAAAGVPTDRHVVVARTVPGADGMPRPDSLLEYVARRGLWPSSGARWCTSDFKTSKIRAGWTPLVRQMRAELGRPVRILNVLGLRAEESPARAGRAAYRHVMANSARHVDEWLPAHNWPVGRVRALCDRDGPGHHWAYDSAPGAGDWAGQSRLSCSLCVLSNTRDLVLAARRRPRLAQLYAEVERVRGHDFRVGLSIARILELAAAPDAPAPGVVVDERGDAFDEFAALVRAALDRPVTRTLDRI